MRVAPVSKERASAALVAGVARNLREEARPFIWRRVVTGYRDDRFLRVESEAEWHQDEILPPGPGQASPIGCILGNLSLGRAQLESRIGNLSSVSSLQRRPLDSTNDGRLPLPIAAASTGASER